MMTLLFVITTALFSADNAKFFDAVNHNRESGYEWQYVGKQSVTNPDYAIAFGDKIYFKHVKED